jgi:hypothetical protein
MVEEGIQWEAHCRTKSHRRAAGIGSGLNARRKCTERSLRREARRGEPVKELGFANVSSMFSSEST